MDQIFVELIGKSELGPARIITFVADHFSFLEDHAKLLKAIYAIPAERHLHLDNVPKHLIQFGPIHSEVAQQVRKEKNWFIHNYLEDLSDDVCDTIDKDVTSNTTDRSIIYVNNISLLELGMPKNGRSATIVRLLRMMSRWKILRNNFVVILYQNSNDSSILLRDLHNLSDAFIRIKWAEDLYYQEIWYQPTPVYKTLIPAKVRTLYFTCKIGKSYWSSDLLCFFDRKQLDIWDMKDNNKEDSPSLLENLALDTDDVSIDRSATLPYIRAQNPEQSKIFYYPDKEDDFDEDDPDNDLDI